MSRIYFITNMKTWNRQRKDRNCAKTFYDFPTSVPSSTKITNTYRLNNHKIKQTRPSKPVIFRVAFPRSSKVTTTCQSNNHMASSHQRSPLQRSPLFSFVEQANFPTATNRNEASDSANSTQIRLARRFPMR